MLGEALRRIGQQPHRLQEVLRHHRAIGVQLELALAAGEGQRGVVAEHLRADLGQRLALGRVDLAGHDRGAGLVLGQRQLAEAGARAGAEQADVAGDLVEAGREGVQRAVGEQQRVLRGEGLELVGRAGRRAGR